MLDSAVQVVSERGYGEMSVTRVTSGAGVSRRTFYELFENREECFLAAFDDAIEEMRQVVSAAFTETVGWRQGVRAALGVLLGHLDDHPEVASLVIVQALGAGPKVLARRARVLASLNTAIDAGRFEVKGRRELPPLTAEGIVGAVFTVIHTRLSERRPAELLDLLNPLMGTIVAPYLGAAAAAKELERPIPVPRARPALVDPLAGLNMRMTYRTLRVLGVIAEQPGASNRQVAAAAEVADQGQMSRLLARLEGLGLVHNAMVSQPTGEANIWELTPRGAEVHQAIHGRKSNRGALPSVTGEITR
jgi:AcrR family transcriptional regulator